MSSRGYQKHDLIKLAASDYEWASTTYTRVGLTAGSASPDGLGLDTDIVFSSTGSIPPVSGSETVSYIIPSILDAVSIIDGIIEMTLNMYVALADTVTTDVYSKITKIELTVRAIDDVGSSRDIVPIHDIWTGTFQIGTGLTSPASDTRQLIIWTDVSDAVLDSSERMVVDLKITYEINARFATGSVGFDVTAGTDASTISLPFVM